MEHRWELVERAGLCALDVRNVVGVAHELGHERFRRRAARQLVRRQQRVHHAVRLERVRVRLRPTRRGTGGVGQRGRMG